MPTLREKIAAEIKVREMLENADVPPPDRVEYANTSIRVFWHEPKVVLVVDFDEIPEELGSVDFGGEAA